MTNLKNSETRVTIGESRTLTMKKYDGYHGYQRRDGKIYHVALSDMSIILGIYTNLFRVT